jgi:hypothetical protein
MPIAVIQAESKAIKQETASQGRHKHEVLSFLSMLGLIGVGCDGDGARP